MANLDLFNPVVKPCVVDKSVIWKFVSLLGNTRPPFEVPFCDVLKNTLTAEQNMQTWCNVCDRYQPHVSYISWVEKSRWRIQWFQNWCGGGRFFGSSQRLWYIQNIRLYVSTVFCADNDLFCFFKTLSYWFDRPRLRPFSTSLMLLPSTVTLRTLVIMNSGEFNTW